MTTFKVVVEDEQAEQMRDLLKQASFIKIIEERDQTGTGDKTSTLEKIKKILDDAKGKNLFADIEDPSEWQRELRKEWDSDF